MASKLFYIGNIKDTRTSDDEPIDKTDLSELVSQISDNQEDCVIISGKGYKVFHENEKSSFTKAKQVLKTDAVDLAEDETLFDYAVRTLSEQDSATPSQIAEHAMSYIQLCETAKRRFESRDKGLAEILNQSNVIYIPTAYDYSDSKLPFRSNGIRASNGLKAVFLGGSLSSDGKQFEEIPAEYLISYNPLEINELLAEKPDVIIASQFIPKVQEYLKAAQNRILVITDPALPQKKYNYLGNLIIEGVNFGMDYSPSRRFLKIEFKDSKPEVEVLKYG